MLKITAENGDEEDRSRDDFDLVAAHKQPQRKETQRGVQYVKSRFCYTLCIHIPYAPATPTLSSL